MRNLDRLFIVIRAVACDLGGVLFSEGKKVVYQTLQDSHGYDSAHLDAVLMSPLSKELRTGRVSDDTFWRWAAEQLPPNYDASLIKKQWYDSYILDHEIAELLKELRRHCKVVAFSGNIKSRIDYLDNKYNFRRLFDDEVYSFDHGVSKPSSEFVEVMVRTAGVAPAEIAYLDDKEHDVAAAVAMGSHAFIYQPENIAQLRQWLSTLLEKPL